MLIALIVFGCAVWIAVDTKNNNIRHGLGTGLQWAPNCGPLGWFILTCICCLYFVPVYLIFRQRLIEANAVVGADGVKRFGENKKCPFCAETIKDEAVVCKFCGREVPTVKDEGNKNAPEQPFGKGLRKCPFCTGYISSDSKLCGLCGKEIPVGSNKR